MALANAGPRRCTAGERRQYPIGRSSNTDISAVALGVSCHTVISSKDLNVANDSPVRFIQRRDVGDLYTFVRVELHALNQEVGVCCPPIARTARSTGGSTEIT